jgi:hypothetical protein
VAINIGQQARDRRLGHFPQCPFVVPNPALQLIWQVTEFGDRVNVFV